MKSCTEYIRCDCVSDNRRQISHSKCFRPLTVEWIALGIAHARLAIKLARSQSSANGDDSHGQRERMHVRENNPFIEGLFEYMDSPEGQLADEVREVTWQLLGKVAVGAAERKLIWHDQSRLSIDESVHRIRAQCPQYPVDLIKSYLIAWLEMEYEPKSYSQVQLDELDRLTAEWVDDHEGLCKPG